MAEIKPIEVEIKVLNAVPYQLCPLCNGEGKALAFGTSSVWQTCKVCNGKMIIPMFVLPETPTT